MKTISEAQLAHWQVQLQQGLEQLDCELSDGQQAQLLQYLALLYKWNQVYNLTAVRNLEQAVSRQLLDSLSVLPWITGPHILDVGTGAGLPGLILAIARPQWQFLLIDSNGKKTRFVQQAISELGLPNVQVQQARIEQVEPALGFDCIVSRAFADLHDMLNLTAHLRAPNGIWVAMKSSIDELRPDELPSGMQHEIVDLQVPGETAARRLVRIH